MFLFGFLATFSFGLIFGSFITCISFRIPRGISFVKGRSFCPTCKTYLHWYHNIPVLSYLLLKGKCASCRQKISPRYPLIELATGVLFSITFLLLSRCGVSNYYLCTFGSQMGEFALPFLLINVVLLVAIFVTDLEDTIIPDEFVFFGIIFNILSFFFFNISPAPGLFSGFFVATLLLLLHLVTLGRGMGLGDVKFAIYAGLFLTPLAALSWILMSFVLGSVVGLSLIVLKKAEFGARIPFGPFLVAGLIITLVVGSVLPL